MSLLPCVAYLVALVLVPLVWTIVDGAWSAWLTGPRSVIADAVLRRSLGDTLALSVLTAVPALILGKILAYVLLARLRGRWLLRFLVLVPWTTPVALSALSWRGLLSALPHGATPWLARPHSAMAAVVAVYVWRLTPLAAAVMMAGLSSVPRDLDDAARLDGAGFWRRAFGVTVPLTLPVDIVAGAVVAAATFGDVAVVPILTGGGPHGATQVLPVLAYLREIRGGEAGRTTAAVLFLLPLLAASAAVVLQAARRAGTAGGGVGDDDGAADGTASIRGTNGGAAHRRRAHGRGREAGEP
jgi:multiple sugar transport system permease protein